MFWPTWLQGGQIGRIFTLWAIVYFGHLWSILLGYFFTEALKLIILKEYGSGYILGNFLTQSHLVALPGSEVFALGDGLVEFDILLVKDSVVLA
jgi:hypothetical protein